MDDSIRERIQLFDPNQEFAILERKLPHWSQAGTVAFITWRTWDSIPRAVLKSWLSERNGWLRQHGVDPSDASWRTYLEGLPKDVVASFRFRMSDRWHEHLDRCHGECVLRRPEIAKVVADSLRHFDGDRYELTDFVVMPNHIHLLAAFPDEKSMTAQCDSWKHFTATSINRTLGRTGRFWQQDAFDHLVRTIEQFEYLRQCITTNPCRAGLREGECVHYSKVLR